MGWAAKIIQQLRLTKTALSMALKGSKGEIKLQDVTFSINVYDSDGERLDNGIFLHYDRVSIIIGSMQDLSNLIEKLTDIQREIKENYPDQNYF
jgi:hypothetical protein